MTNNTTAPALTDEQILDFFSAAGVELNATPNMLYTVRGQHAQLVKAARALLTSPRAAVLPDVIEATASQWDGCFFDAPGGCDIDIGEAIRAAAKRLEAAPDAPVAEPRAAVLEEWSVSRIDEGTISIMSPNGREAQMYSSECYTVASCDVPIIYDFISSILEAAPAAPVAEYDGNHVQNHCTECNEHEAECSCAQAVAADGEGEYQWLAETQSEFVSALILAICELPDRHSPADEPGAMVANSDEIAHCVGVALEKTGLSISRRAAVSPATAEPEEVRAHVKWLHSCLRDAGYCIDGGKCHHECGSKGDCFRQAGCVPLTGSHLSDDWTLPVASEPATADERAALTFDEWRSTYADAMSASDATLARSAARASQAAAPAEAREITMTVEDAMRIVMANWGDKDAIERVFRANVAPADAGEPVAQWQTRVRDVQIEGRRWTNVSEEGAKTVLEKYHDAYEVRALYERPAPADAGEAVDAARYRIMRSGVPLTVDLGEGKKRVIYYIGAKLEAGFGEALDSAIDAILAQGAQGGKGGEA
ncbi:hypothetical protein [Burkholderia glumae]|uniref:hypothetical protein n=1 Tax=Burkholderia glumae TaxID=337 RepID=UPI0020CE9B75|nr:hypothetical protein [Burkholderia glumae]MCQ0033621.1 hypothetical protein [Burkholderia glumae]MCQ0037953.1 hypothetical protein [Burkholderia glumae]